MKTLLRWAVVSLFAVIGCDGSTLPGEVSQCPGQWFVADLAYGDGRWVGVGGQSLPGDCTTQSLRPVIATSVDDGDVWHVKATPGEGLLNAVAYGDGVWIAVGGRPAASNSSRLIVRSEDGWDWQRVVEGDGFALQSVAFGSAGFVTMSRDLGGTSGLSSWVSLDGRGWRLGQVPASWFGPQVVATEDGYFAFGEGNALAHSEEGLQWSLRRVAGSQVNYLVEVEGGLAAATTDDCCFGEEPELIERIALFRESGGEWATVGTASADGTPPWLPAQVAVGPERALGVAGGRVMQTVLTPGDVHWELLPSPSSAMALGYGGGQFAMFADGGILTSSDGASWLPGAVDVALSVAEVSDDDL